MFIFSLHIGDYIAPCIILLYDCAFVTFVIKGYLI